MHGDFKKRCLQIKFGKQMKKLEIKLPEIDEETLKKLPYWKQWLYRTIKEIQSEK